MGKRLRAAWAIVRFVVVVLVMAAVLFVGALFVLDVLRIVIEGE